ASKPDEVISPVRLVVADDKKSISSTTESTVGNQRMSPLDSRQSVKQQIPDELSEKQLPSETPKRTNIDGATSDSSKDRFSGLTNAQKPEVRKVYNTNYSPGKVAVMSQFQQMMNRFLETQKNVMLTYIQRASDGTKPSVEQFLEAPSARRGGVEVSAEFPAEKPESQAEFDTASLSSDESAQKPAEQDLTPIASPLPSEPVLKRTRTFSETTVTEPSEYEFTDVKRMEPQPLEPKPPEDMPLNRETLVSRLLEIVSERTGYPPEMLDLDLDLEADLGIDSIKRIEILSSFQEASALSDQLQSEGANGQDEQSEADTMEELAGIKTLRGIIDWIEKRINSAMGAESDIEESESEISQQVQGKTVTLEGLSLEGLSEEMSGEEDDKVQRFLLRTIEAPLNGKPASLAANRVLLLTDDENGIAQALAEKLRGLGHITALVRIDGRTEEIAPGLYAAELTSLESVARLIDIIHRKQGMIGGVVHLLPFKDRRDFGEMDLSSWMTRFQLEVKSLFYLSKCLAGELKEAALDGDAFIVTATGMGGTFASDGLNNSLAPEISLPGQGSVAGLMKTIAREWSEVQIRVVDLNPETPTETIIEQLLKEINTKDKNVEVGYDDSRRLILGLEEAPIDEKASMTLNIDSSDVILITGGARGITADVAIDLAKRYQPTLILVGRSSLPPPQESPDTVGLDSPQDLKAALIKRMRGEGRIVTPAQVEAAYVRLIRDREMRDNIAAMKNVGAKVEYYSVDVQN
ncbi:MAG: SDR family oxidoreductase, partial [Candidatus Poribacteria bacterium]